MISKGGGRTFDPAFIAIAKRDYNDDKFQGFGPTYHNRPYEYGNSFLRFYLETYGVEKISESIDIPTIGIGGGVHCDGQIQVVNDLLGLFTNFIPKHAKRYVNLGEQIKTAFKDYVVDVKEEKFPTDDNSF